MKRVLIISAVILIAIVGFTVYYFGKPDLTIVSVVRDKTLDSSLCKYNLEIKNNGFSKINSIISYCFWPDEKTKCGFLSDVLVRNPETGYTEALNLKGRETYAFEMVPIPSNSLGGSCPRVMHFCIDCNSHIVYDKEVIDGAIDESREGNNEYTYIE